MRTLKLTENTKKELLGNLLNRNPGSYTEYENTVNEIINDIRNNGDKALFEYTAKFDKCTLDASCIKITDDEIKEAYAALDPEFIEVMKKSADNIRVFHEKQKRNTWIDTREDGSILGQRILPIEISGVYVPGGKAAYPSSVLMNVVPAKVAGVGALGVATGGAGLAGAGALALAGAGIGAGAAARHQWKNGFGDSKAWKDTGVAV